MLTPKQKRFVDEYLVDLNAAQAAIRAGYAVKAANREGSCLLSKVDIQTLITQGQAKVAERAGITSERVLLELKRLCPADPRKLFDDSG